MAAVLVYASRREVTETNSESERDLQKLEKSA